MMKHTTVLINSFRRKLGVYSVMSAKQIIFRKKFKTPLCKMGELMLVYDLQANNRTSKSRAFYALHIRPNDGGTGYSVFKFSKKKMIIIPRCKPVFMPDNVIEVVDQMGKDEGMLNGIMFCNILKEFNLDDMY